MAFSERRKKWDKRFDEIHELAMFYETAVIPFFKDDYLKEFYDFYKIRNRKAVLTSSEEDFHETLKEVCGVGRGEPIAEEAERLFGLPRKITVFEDFRELKDELEGPRGYAPFFFVFDLAFCEYENFTLCFMSGTNN